MTVNVLVRATDGSVATGIVTRSVVTNHVGFSSWAIHADFPEHLLVFATKNGIATGILTRGIIPAPVGLTSGARQAQVTPDLLV
jgi:hypothetical protein